MRLTRSLFKPSELRLQCFVDDPLAAIKGTPLRRKTIIATITLVWEALNCKLAYQKGQTGPSVEWTGAEFAITPGVLIAKVKEAIITDIKMSLEAFSKINKIPLKDLRSFTGKVNHAAGLLVPIRPFLQTLWAALYQADNVRTRRVWKKCISQTLLWLQAVFNNAAPIGLERKFNLRDVLGQGDHLEISTDASPHGL